MQLVIWGDTEAVKFALLNEILGVRNTYLLGQRNRTDGNSWKSGWEDGSRD